MEQRPSVGRLRARDIRETFKGRAIDPAITHTLEMLAEQDGVLRQQIGTLAELFNNMQDTLNQLIAVMGVMKDRVDAQELIKQDAINLIERQEIPTEGDK